MSAEGSRVQRKPRGAGFHDVCDDSSCEPLAAYALGSPIPDPAEQGALVNAGRCSPGFHCLNRASDIAAWDRNLAAEAILVGLAPTNGSQEAPLGSLRDPRH